MKKIISTLSLAGALGCSFLSVKSVDAVTNIEIPPPLEAETVDSPDRIYRVYNPNSGEHLFTKYTFERNSLLVLGWQDEGTAWLAPSDRAKDKIIFVHRLYNPNASDHHYTSDITEADQLVTVGWKRDQLGFYSLKTSDLPIYRLYNPNATGAGAHHLTLYTTEKNQLVKAGWRDEGISMYATGVK